jgi:hypothetical protein
MLLLFALSVTPKQWLHDIITGHKHSYVVFGEENYKASKNSFQCNWNTLEVESPFTHQPDFQFEHPAIVHSAYFNHYILNEYSAEIILSLLRGPPAHA